MLTEKERRKMNCASGEANKKEMADNWSAKRIRMCFFVSWKCHFLNGFVWTRKQLL